MDKHPDIAELKRLLLASDLPVMKIAADTGVSARWINYLRSEQEYAGDPGANRIWMLLSYLRARDGSVVPSEKERA